MNGEPFGAKLPRHRVLLAQKVDFIIRVVGSVKATSLKYGWSTRNLSRYRAGGPCDFKTLDAIEVAYDVAWERRGEYAERLMKKQQRQSKVRELERQQEAAADWYEEQRRIDNARQQKLIDGQPPIS